MINRDYMILTAIFAVAVTSLTEYILFADKMMKVKKNADKEKKKYATEMYNFGVIMGREEDYDMGYDDGYDEGFDDGYNAGSDNKTKRKIVEEKNS